MHLLIFQLLFRCIPVFSLVSLFYATIYYKLGSGPLWNKIIGTEKGYCEQNWWTNILLLNNYLNVENLVSGIKKI